MGFAMAECLVCTPKRLPLEQEIPAAALAARLNPLNKPPLHRLAALAPRFDATPERIAVLTTKYWRTNGVRLGVKFLEETPQNLKDRILSHMNAWATRANVKFLLSDTDPEVRISRSGQGYWSYVGTDILTIAAGQPTMNLQDFTMNTSESEFKRVVRHETGHTLGCPHEHMRRELVDRIDPDKAIRFFGQTQGWSAQEIRAQVLTPIEEGSLIGTDHSDTNSIMCYQLPGAVTKDGNPILGGLDIDELDYAFMAKIYPKTAGAQVLQAEIVEADRVHAAATLGEPSRTTGFGTVEGLQRELGRMAAERDTLKRALLIMTEGLH
jgi:hypothetical protein